MKNNHGYLCYDISTRTLYRDGDREFGNPNKDFPDKLDYYDPDEFIIRIVSDHSMCYEILTRFLYTYPKDIVEDYRALKKALDENPSLESARMVPKRLDWKEPVEKRRRLW